MDAREVLSVLILSSATPPAFAYSILEHHLPIRPAQATGNFQIETSPFVDNAAEEAFSQQICPKESRVIDTFPTVAQGAERFFLRWSYKKALL